MNLIQYQIFKCNHLNKFRKTPGQMSMFFHSPFLWVDVINQIWNLIMLYYNQVVEKIQSMVLNSSEMPEFLNLFNKCWTNLLKSSHKIRCIFLFELKN